MIRTVVTPEDEHISILVPKTFIGKQVEVIAFTTDEGTTEEKPVQKKVSFTALSIDTRNYKFNCDEANER